VKPVFRGCIVEIRIRIFRAKRKVVEKTLDQKVYFSIYTFTRGRNVFSYELINKILKAHLNRIVTIFRPEDGGSMFLGSQHCVKTQNTIINKRDLLA
jgi:hypothetical protein